MSTLSDNVYTLAEEIANGLTHGLGALASLVGLVVLVAYAAVYGEATHVAAVSIYGGSLVLLYTASTLYHSIPIPAAKRVFKILDHSAIYVLIAGTYTPFALISLEGPDRWALFTTVWTLAALGILFKLFFTGRLEKLSVAMYLGMGWVAVAFADPVLKAIPTPALWLMFAGGMAYTLGVIFYMWNQLKFSHAIWHLFVMTGSLLHFFAVFWYVLPPAPVA